MTRHEEIKLDFSKTKSYSETGRNFGISRQRVHQIVAGYKNYGVSGRERLYNLAWKNTCEVCLKNPTTALHHKNKDNKDDRKENLMSVCHSCHIELHLSKLGKKRKEYKFKAKDWSRKHPNKCDLCGVKKYYARGVCVQCYNAVLNYSLSL